MHLCHGADAVDAISPCGAGFLFVVRVPFCLPSRFPRFPSLPPSLSSAALSQMGLNGAQNVAACSSGTLGSAEDESNLWPWGSQGKVGREGVLRRGRALRGEDGENISAEGSVRAALGSELHAMHGRSRKKYFPPGFSCVQAGKGPAVPCVCCPWAAQHYSQIVVGVRAVLLLPPVDDEHGDSHADDEHRGDDASHDPNDAARGALR